MITFPSFHRWRAIVLDNTAMGYFAHSNGHSDLHLKKDVPAWLNTLKRKYDNNDACQAAITAAYQTRPRDLFSNVVELFP